MPQAVAQTIVTALVLYAGAGVVFAVAFVLAGVDRIDPVARASGRAFRVMILPGAVALWPWLLLRWIRRAPPREERNAHRAAARRS